MVVFLYETPEYEDQLLGEIQRRHAQASALYAMMNQDLVNRVTSLAATHGSYMQPGVIEALALTGMDEDPIAIQAISESEANRELNDGGWATKLGEWFIGLGPKQEANKEKIKNVVSTPFTTNPEGTAETIVSAPFRTVTAPLRSDIGKKGVQGLMTGWDFIWEEGVSRPLRWAMQGEIERGGNFWSMINPIPDFSLLSPGEDESMGEAIGNWAGRVANPNAEGQVDQMLDDYRGTGRSAGLIAMQEGLDLGEGLFPQGRAGALSLAEREGIEGIGGIGGVLDQFSDEPEFQDQLITAADQAYMYHGKPLSMGRFAAVELFEPDTRAYNLLSGLIDASLIIGLDPASAALQKAGDINRIRRNFGVVDGSRVGVDVDAAVENFLTKKSGQNLTRWLAETDDFEDIYRALGKNAPVQVANELVDATNPEEVFGILNRELGHSIRTRPSDPTRLLPRARRPLDSIRLLNDMPGSYLPTSDLDQAIPHLRNYLINARLPDATRKSILAEAARLTPGDRPEWIALMRRTYADIDKHLATEIGWDALRKPLNLAQRYARVYDEFETVGRKYFVDELGRDTWFPGARAQSTLSGEEVPLATAQLFSEMMESGLPLLNVRELRRQASKLGRLMDLPGVDWTLLMNDGYLSHIWKPLQLFRGAWAVRVLGDEWMRMSMVGLDSPFRHPFSWLAWVTGRKGDVPLEVRKALDDGDSQQVIKWMIADSEQHRASMQMRDAGWKGTDPSRGVWTGDYDVYNRDHSGFLDAWAGEIQQLAKDDVARRVAGGLSPEDLRSIQAVPLARPWNAGHPMDKITDSVATSWVERFIEFDRSANPLDPKKYQDLLDDIAQNGIKEPLMLEVSKEGGTALLIEGNHRLAAARQLGIEEVPVRVIVRKSKHGGYGNPPVDVRGEVADDLFTPFFPNDARPSDVFPGLTAKAKVEGMDAVKTWFWQGEGQRFRRQIVEGRGQSPKSQRLSTADQQLYGYETFTDAMTYSRQFADDYLDAILRRIQIKTGNNPDLINLVSTGHLGNRSIINQFSNKHLRNYLEQHADSAPDFAKGPRMVDEDLLGGRSSLRRAMDGVDKATEWGFHMLGAVPTNKLSRSPAFRQFYWKRMEAQSVFMDAATRRQAAQAARAAGLKDTARNIETMGGAVQSSRRKLVRHSSDTALAVDGVPQHQLDRIGDLGEFKARPLLASFDEADEVAKHVALTETRRLLYDLEKRSQFMDIFRHFFPFGEAFKEIFTTWARIGMERPQTVRRAQIGVEGARGSGFFYTDPDSGEEMFGYPGGGLIASALGMGDGQSLGLEGRVTGLNMLDLSNGVIPGIGPVAGWSAARFIPDHPDWNWVNEQLFPFGKPGTSFEEIATHFALPAWTRRFLQGLSEGEYDERGWNNAVKDVAAALIASGQYSTNETNEALEHASKTSRYLFIIRGLAQSILPTGPSVKFEQEDKDGQWFTTQILSADYREMLDKHDGDNELATSEFIHKYGIDPLHVSQPRTRTLRHRHLSQPGVDWERENQDLIASLPLTMGLWTPPDEEGNYVEGDLDFSKYLDEISDGNLKALTAQDQLYMANNIRGWMLFRKRRDQVLEAFGDTPETRGLLAAYKQSLQAEFPGFDQIHITVPEGARTEDLVQELEQVWADPDPRLEETLTWEAFDKYMRARSEVLAIAESRGVGLGAEVTNADLRKALEVYGGQLVEQYPGFQQMWRRALSLEVRE